MSEAAESEPGLEDLGPDALLDLLALEDAKTSGLLRYTRLPNGDTHWTGPGNPHVASTRLDHH